MRLGEVDQFRSAEVDQFHAAGNNFAEEML